MGTSWVGSLKIKFIKNNCTISKHSHDKISLQSATLLTYLDMILKVFRSCTEVSISPYLGVFEKIMFLYDRVVPI